MTTVNAPSGPQRTDHVNTRRMLRVVIALTVAMAVGVGLCWAMAEPSELPEIYRILRPRGMADPADWRYIIIRDSGGANGVYDPTRPNGQGGHFVIGNGKGPVLKDGQIVSTALWKTQQRWKSDAVSGISPRTPGDFPGAIAIVVVGDFRSTPPTSAQLNSLATLVYELSSRYRTIPLTNVRMYWELTARPDDGADFPMDDFLRRVGEDHRRK